MRRALQILAAFLPCLVLSSCATTMHGEESSRDGATVVAVSAATAATVSSSNASATVVYGTPAPASAPGGHLTLSSSSSSGALAGVIILGVIAGYIVGEEGPKPLPPGTKLLHTCSCYGYKPPVSGETRVADSKP